MAIKNTQCHLSSKCYTKKRKIEHRLGKLMVPVASLDVA